MNQTMAGTGSPFPIPADRTAASGRSGRCKETTAPETDCSGVYCGFQKKKITGDRHTPE